MITYKPSVEAGGFTNCINKLLHVSQQERKRIMNTCKRIVLALVIGVLLGVSLAGCNTFRGAGQDIQRGGQAIENTAEDAQRN